MMTGFKPALWRRILSPILDFITVFAAGGHAIAVATNSTTPRGFDLNGTPALLLFVLILAYFVCGRWIGGGTLWDRILGIPRSLLP
jgi:hypothetical protein